MRIALLGLGLIGGSIARALRAGDEATRPALVAWTPRGEGPRAAVAAGTIDEAAPGLAEAVRGADLIILAAPPAATLDLLDALAGLAPGTLAAAAVITDVASTKSTIVERAARLGLRFVGGHPMAGRDTSGFGAAATDLFVGRPWVVVAGDGTRQSDVVLVEDLARACGADPVRMDAVSHDVLTASISHVPLVAAAALVEAVAGPPGVASPDDWDGARRLAASGWRDATRLARGDPAMGAGILATNAPAVAARLRILVGRLEAWIGELEAPDGPTVDRLASLLAADRERALEAPAAAGGDGVADGRGWPVEHPERPR
jgi:prephenate dehydrogenase